jgi:hypothetical protein
MDNVKWKGYCILSTSRVSGVLSLIALCRHAHSHFTLNTTSFYNIDFGLGHHHLFRLALSDLLPNGSILLEGIEGFGNSVC